LDKENKMSTYTLTLTAAENAALSYIASSQQDWIDNAVHERCRVAIEEIVALTVQKCLETNTPIPGSKDAMVTLAFEQGWVKTAEQRQAEAAELAERQEQSAE
jgi:hypothetical protein